jgi:hypothetical protein
VTNDFEREGGVVMFGRVKGHPGELSLDVFKDLPANATELARFWVTGERSYVAVGRSEGWEPELLGSLLVECLHTAAAGYAARETMSESEALERMWRGVDEERLRLGSSESSEGNY